MPDIYFSVCGVWLLLLRAGARVRRTRCLRLWTRELQPSASRGRPLTSRGRALPTLVDAGTATVFLPWARPDFTRARPAYACGRGNCNRPRLVGAHSLHGVFIRKGRRWMFQDVLLGGETDFAIR